MFGVMLILHIHMLVCIATFSSEDTSQLKSKLVPGISSPKLSFYLSVMGRVSPVPNHTFHTYRFLYISQYQSIQAPLDNLDMSNKNDQLAVIQHYYKMLGMPEDEIKDNMEMMLSLIHI